MKILITLFSIIHLSACSSTPRSSVNSFAPSNRGILIRQIAENYFESVLKLEPLYATSIGDHRFDDQLSIPLTEEHRQQMIALQKLTQAELKKTGCQDLDEQNTLTCESLSDDLDAAIELSKADIDYLMPVNQFDSFFMDFPDLASGSSYVTLDTKQDFENFLKRMKVVPQYFETMIANMKLGMKKKITTPRPLVLKALKQMKELLVSDYHQSVFAKPLAKLEKISPSSEKDGLFARYDSVIRNEIYPAYQKLEAFTRTQYLPNTRTTHGLSSLPGGKDLYRALARVHTTTTLTPDQIHSLGLSEVKRIQAEFETVKTEFKFKGTLKKFLQAMREDQKLYPFRNSKQVMDAYEQIHQRIMSRVPEQFSVLPKAKFEIREVEKFKAENASEAYQNPSADGARPGIFWVPIPDPRRYSSKDMESLFLHEAIPGHHFQISLQQELQELPRYRRFSGNNAYVEGWALYTEGLGKELGMYTDPYQWVGRLSNEMHRAVRLVVDTGIHWKGWTRERAIKYSLDHEAYDKNSIISEIERYMAIPGQALSYKIGELKYLELKKVAKTQLGSKYDVRTFHSEMLKDGALPLSTLEKKFNRWLTHQ